MCYRHNNLDATPSVARCISDDPTYQNAPKIVPRGVAEYERHALVGMDRDRPSGGWREQDYRPRVDHFQGHMNYSIVNARSTEFRGHSGCVSERGGQPLAGHQLPEAVITLMASHD
jgi:hypothetical protein